MIKYLTPISNDVSTMSLYIQDYCNNYQTALTQRTAFVQTMMATDSTEFNTVCLDYLKTYSTQLNYWFDPIDPITSIS
jgi:hypothetical protein